MCKAWGLRTQKIVTLVFSAMVGDPEEFRFVFMSSPCDDICGFPTIKGTLLGVPFSGVYQGSAI